MRKSGYLLVTVSIILLTMGLAAAKDSKLPPSFVLQPILTGLDRPSAMVVTGDGRIFVAERYTGNVRLVRQGKLVPDPVVTVSVPAAADPETDEGLLDIAFDPAGPDDGYLYLFYTDAATGDNKIVRYTLLGDSAGSPFVVKNLGSSLNHDRIGGGLAMGSDGLLYIGVGDMGSPGEAQNPGSDLGKVLQITGSGSVRFAMGFRDGVGLAAHPDVSTLYLTDRGPDAEYDELNAVASGNNHGWPTYIGPFGSGADTLPINWHQPIVGIRGLSAYTGTHFPDGSGDGTDNDMDGTLDESDESYRDSVFYSCYDSNDIVRSVLTGVDLDAQDSAHKFFDPTMEWDGSPDTGCPPNWIDVAEGGDGMLYVLADDSDGTADQSGLYRIVYDRPGPREVSPPGSALPLTVEKDGSNLALYWENLGREAWIGNTTGASQPAEFYTLWEGSLPITGGAYSHTVKATTNGTAVNEGLLSQPVTPDSGNTYYLASHQGANLEGTLGKRTGSLERPGKLLQDYCHEIGWFDNERGDSLKETSCDGLDNDGDGSTDESCPGRCGPDFVDGTGAPARLLGQNGTYWTLWDFRGQVLHLDISALNCGYCKLQAPVYSELYDENAGRGFNTITVLMESYSTRAAIPPEDCDMQIQWWIDNFAPDTDHPVLCAADDDGDSVSDIYEQYGELLQPGSGRCTGTPMNFYFDQGMVMYDFVCGKYRGDCDGGYCVKKPATKCVIDDDCQGNDTCFIPTCHEDADCGQAGGTQTCDHYQQREVVQRYLPAEHCE